MEMDMEGAAQAYAQPTQGKALSTRKYKNNPYANDEESGHPVSTRRNQKLDLTQNAPESKYLQQQVLKSGRSAKP
jgi:hypothetical protein